MARKPTTLSAYIKSVQDKREDAANAEDCWNACFHIQENFPGESD